MGLWLKCPQCQAANPLDAKNCLKCNASLTNLPAAERVYILGNSAPLAPEPVVPPAAPTPPAEPGPEAEGQAVVETTPAAGSPEHNTAGKTAVKRSKGRKSRKKKT
ncbi:MAG: hypothetical protein ACUVXF_06135 [Desulfobaccales bacterium]